MALQVYAADFDERYPLTIQWAEAARSRAQGVTGGRRADYLFRCPSASSAFGYGMNAKMGGVKSEKLVAPADTVLLFDANAPVPSFAGGPGHVARNRHNGTSILAFADGHAKKVNGDTIRQFSWSPAFETGSDR